MHCLLSYSYDILLASFANWKVHDRSCTVDSILLSSFDSMEDGSNSSPVTALGHLVRFSVVFLGYRLLERFSQCIK